MLPSVARLHIATVGVNEIILQQPVKLYPKPPAKASAQTHPMSEIRFQLRQRPANGCLYVILFVVLVWGPIFIAIVLTSTVTDQWGASFFVLFPVLLFGIVALEKRLVADTVATAGEEAFQLEVVKPGLRLKAATANFPWVMLRDFRFARGGRSGPVLQLCWSDGSVQYFVGGDLRALFKYLKTHFPDRRYSGCLYE